jgi:hypothetical protein
VAARICTRCGGRRIPITGWSPEITAHPECLNTPAWVWTPQQMREWLAAREPNTTVSPSTSAVDGRGDRSA